MIRHHAGFTNVIYTFHLSPTSFDQDLGLTKADNVASLHPCGLIFTALIRICDIERDKQNQLVRLRPHYHLCLRDIHDVATRACGQEICQAADYQWLWNQPGVMSCNVKHWEMMVLTWADRLLSLTSFFFFFWRWMGKRGWSHPSECLGGFASSRTFFHLAWGGACSLHLQLSSEVTPQSRWFGLNWDLISSSHFQSEWNLLSGTRHTTLS